MIKPPPSHNHSYIKSALVTSLVILFVISMIVLFVIMQYQNNADHRENLYKTLKENDCYMISGNYQRSPYNINFQCFKQNTRVNVLVDFSTIDEVHSQFDLNNQDVDTPNKDEKRLYIALASEHKRQCKLGEDYIYCDLHNQPMKIYNNFIN